MFIIALVLALLASVLSVSRLLRIAVQQHNAKQPRTLSQLAASQDYLLKKFRITLFVCGSLFAVAVYAYIVPNIAHAPLLFIFWSLTYFGNVAAAVIPARGKTHKIHTRLAQIMATGMLAMAFLFAFAAQFDGAFKVAEIMLATAMLIASMLTIIDTRKFIFYELLFLFMSHTTIVIAIIALQM
jgi:hypothetical protein